MRPKFDIFTRLPDGHPVLVECCENLSEARERLMELARNAGGDFFIYSEEKAVVEVVVHGKVAPDTGSPDE